MIRSDLIGALILFAYYLVACALIPMPLKCFTRIPAEVIRKFQHIAYSMSIFLLLHLFSAWYAAIVASLLLVAVGYPVLFALERTRWYNRAFADRTTGGGEFRSSLLAVQATFAVLITVLWGGLGARWAPVIGVAVMGWGFGDAAAALIGKWWGRRRVVLRWVDGAKTWEGFISMVVFAAVAITLTLFLYVRLPWYRSLAIGALAAPLCGIAELVSRRGSDTVVVPIVAAATIAPLMALFSGVGW